MEILWVDDDSPKKPESIEGVTIFSAQSIKQAEDLLQSGEVKPSWIVVDLIVPQSGWGKALLAVPGIDYLRHLRIKCPSNVGLVAYGVALTDRKRKAAKAAGAQSVYEKMSSSWIDVITDLAQSSPCAMEE